MIPFSSENSNPLCLEVFHWYWNIISREFFCYIRFICTMGKISVYISYFSIIYCLGWSCSHWGISRMAWRSTPPTWPPRRTRTRSSSHERDNVTKLWTANGFSFFIGLHFLPCRCKTGFWNRAEESCHWESAVEVISTELNADPNRFSTGVLLTAIIVCWLPQCSGNA